jgi:hypothetical protein
MTATARALVEQLLAVSEAFIELVESVSPNQWPRLPSPGTWSASKDAEHVAEGNALHQWVVRSTLRQRPGARPVVERARMTAQMSQSDVVELLRERKRESVNLIASLGDAELALPCRTDTLGEFIARGLIGHIRTHHREIESKLRH